jgi:hypothetical protein
MVATALTNFFVAAEGMVGSRANRSENPQLYRAARQP